VITATSIQKGQEELTLKTPQPNVGFLSFADESVEEIARESCAMLGVFVCVYLFIYLCLFVCLLICLFMRLFISLFIFN
jgi:hypothetical protein